MNDAQQDGDQRGVEEGDAAELEGAAAIRAPAQRNNCRAGQEGLNETS